MAKVIAETWEGRTLTYNGTYDECNDVFEHESDELNPDKVKHYKLLKLVNDIGYTVASKLNISKLEAKGMLATIREKIGRDFADDEEINKVMGYPVTRKFRAAWIGYNLSERQGGCWILL